MNNRDRQRLAEDIDGVTKWGARTGSGVGFYLDNPSLIRIVSALPRSEQIKILDELNSDHDAIARLIVFAVSADYPVRQKWLVKRVLSVWPRSTSNFIKNLRGWSPGLDSVQEGYHRRYLPKAFQSIGNRMPNNIEPLMKNAYDRL